MPGAADETNPAVTNILRLLQSLDVDGNPDNNITITPQIASEVNGRPINFHTSVANFDNAEIADLFESLHDQGAFSADSPRDLRTPAKMEKLHCLWVWKMELELKTIYLMSLISRIEELAILL